MLHIFSKLFFSLHLVYCIAVLHVCGTVVVKSQDACCQTVLSCLDEHKGQTGQKGQKTDIFSIFSHNHEYLCLYIHLHVRIKTVNSNQHFVSQLGCLCMCILAKCLYGDGCSSEICSHNLIGLVVLRVGRQDNSCPVSLSFVYTSRAYWSILKRSPSSKN